MWISSKKGAQIRIHNLYQFNIVCQSNRSPIYVVFLLVYACQQQHEILEFISTKWRIWIHREKTTSGECIDMGFNMTEFEFEAKFYKK